MTISDIVTKTYFYTKTNASSFPAADMLISINTGYNRVGSLVLKSDDRWQWDDTNQTDLPIATTSLVSGQQDYSLASAHLTIDRVEIKNSAGAWTELQQIDQQQFKGSKQIALAALFPTNGVPLLYDVSGNSVFLYPTPNYSQAVSLKLYFTRGPAEFTSADVSTGTKQPGFNSLFHELIPLWVAYDYAVANGLSTANGFFAAIQLKEKALYDFYGLRNRDTRPRFTISTNAQGGDQSGVLTSRGGESNK